MKQPYSVIAKYKYLGYIDWSMGSQFF